MKVKYYHIVIVILGVVLFLLGASVMWGLTPFQPAPAAASNALQAGEAPARTITVIGEGKGSGQPDLARVNLGVQVSDPDVKAATQKAADDMEAVLAALQAQGVAPADIQTSYYNLYVERPFNPEGTTTQPIYQVSNTLEVTIRDLEQVTTILGAAIEAGANNINSVSFDITDPAEIRSEARQNAVEDAEITAAELAQLNGLTLGDVVSVSEVVQPGIFYDAAAQGVGGGVAGPITPGDVTVTVQLEVTYAIVQ